MRDNKGTRMATAMAVAGRAARACDVCGRNRARWFCAPDEAYLCDGCDGSVHAANALARRHERFRLAPNGTHMKLERKSNNIAGAGGGAGSDPVSRLVPNGGGAKKFKTSTSRPGASPLGGGEILHQVPGKSLLSPSAPASEASVNLREVKVEAAGSSSEPSDHFTAEELTGNANLLDSPAAAFENSSMGGAGSRGPMAEFGQDFLVSDPGDGNHAEAGDEEEEEEEEEEDGLNCEGGEDEGLNEGSEWLGSGGRGGELDLCGDRELSDDEYCVDLEALQGSVSESDHSAAVYAHDEHHKSSDLCGSSTAASRGGSRPFKGVTGQAEWVKLEEGGGAGGGDVHAPCKVEGWNDCDLRQVPTLRLDYADVLNSWSDRGTLWTIDNDLHNPQLVPDDSNSDAAMGSYDMGLVPDMSAGGAGGPMTMFGSHDDLVSAGNAREARVSRYREKRRTRLFSKKIRYEVRKLNAERRPRMKGRFVKRSPGRE